MLQMRSWSTCFVTSRMCKLLLQRLQCITWSITYTRRSRQGVSESTTGGDMPVQTYESDLFRLQTVTQGNSAASAEPVTTVADFKE